MNGDRTSLGGFLRELKDRNGHSYQALSRKVNLSKSALHRYCNDPRYFTGSTATLVEMTKRAERIIESRDRSATVVCPGMGGLWTPQGRDALLRFARLGGYNYCDVASVKLHQVSAADPPETMLELAGVVDDTFHQAGLQPRIWNTGTAYSISLQRPLDEATARSYAVRFFLVGLFGRALNVERMYFYNWGGTKVPIVLQPDGGDPTPAAEAVAELEHWLTAAKIRSCGHGQAMSLPDNAWECRFTLGDDKPASIIWTQAGTASVVAGSDDVALERLDGTSQRLSPGDSLTLTGDPVMIR